MKKILAVAMTAVGCATIASAGVANSISGIHNVKTHYPWDGKVDISYTSTSGDGEGNILLDIGPTKRIITLSKTDIAVGNHTKTFDLREMFGEFKAEVLASVDWVRSQPPDDAKGTATGILGDLMTITVCNDYESPSVLQQFEVNVYTNVDIGTFNCDTYKTTKLALLRIPAGGIWPARPGSSAEDKIVTTIAPAKDYWISIFPVTCLPYTLVAGVSTTYGLSAQMAKYSTSRLNPRSDDISKPTDEVTEDSFMGILKKKTKLNGKFDLPTEMQWEIAARAGSTSPYGHYVKGGAPKEGSSENVADFARCSSDKYQDVGQLCPNMWGLYDMMGNAFEWCLDQYEDRVEWTDVETPHFNGESNLRVIRGGWWKSGPQECRPSYRRGLAADTTQLNKGESAAVGFRVCYMPE